MSYHYSFFFLVYKKEDLLGSSVMDQRGLRWGADIKEGLLQDFQEYNAHYLFTGPILEIHMTLQPSGTGCLQPLYLLFDLH